LGSKSIEDNGYVLDLQSFRKLFSESLGRGAGMRARRELINVLGYGMKYLFGIADARDVTRLNTVCDMLAELKSQVTHAVDHQLT
jgi:hypothetical protein